MGDFWRLTIVGNIRTVIMPQKWVYLRTRLGIILNSLEYYYNP